MQYASCCMHAEYDAKYVLTTDRHESMAWQDDKMVEAGGMAWSRRRGLLGPNWLHSTLTGKCVFCLQVAKA